MQLSHFKISNLYERLELGNKCCTAVINTSHSTVRCVLGQLEIVYIMNEVRQNGITNHSNNGIKSVEEYPLWMFWKRRRYVVAVLAFFGFFNVYSLRVNLSIAIVSMTENKTIIHENGTVTYEREFDWDSRVQGYVLSSFFYGYICTQIFGGWLANKIGGQKVYGIGIAVTAGFTIITPILAHTSVYLLIAVRIIEGIFEGVTYPCIHSVWSRWAPPLERSRIATLAFSGSYVGTVVSMALSAYLADGLGWESIFYVFGAVGIIWFLCWWFLIFEGPEVDPWITPEELKHIQDSLENSKVEKNIKHPWKSIFASLPVWAIVVSHFSENWGFYTLLTQLPMFMKDMLNFDLGQTGIMSAIPYLAMAIMMQFSGHSADWFRERGILTTTQVRKIYNCSAFVAQTVFLLGTGFAGSAVGSTICLTLAVGLGAFAWAGFSVNHLDVAPQHASVLMGVSNTFATLPGIFSPIISGYIVTTPTNDEWRIVFYISSAIYLFGCVFYGIFASGELQSWAIESEPLTKASPPEKQGVVNERFEMD
ncbi:hypothetical protein Trydic_g10427 [Trypoxylus dichotomus]